MSARNQKKGPRSYVYQAFFLLVIFVAGWLAIKEIRLDRPEQLYTTASGRLDMCLSCHKTEKLDPAHDRRVIGCAACHLGDALAIEKEQAHSGMVMNPGDLRVVEKTCGVDGCHSADVKKVKNSLMATNRGILGTLLYYWGESDGQDTALTVEKLMETGQNSLAIDYYRKLCATCHLWKRKNDLPDAEPFFNEKGGGCSSCHFVMPEGQKARGITEAIDETEDNSQPAGEKKHPLIIKKVPNDNCIKCHNRSGRIGISYTGVFESEGYGTPFEGGGLSSRQLPGSRFYLEIAEDIHHEKGMACIDCHTRDEIMGDGTSYAHYEEQLEISCEMCHSSNPGTTDKKNKVTNIIKTGKSYQLLGKLDEKRYSLAQPKEGVCDFKAHKRIGCEACHSTWVPQCYGCHVKRDMSEEDLDKLSLEQTKGKWTEGRSYIRYEKPMLGVWKDKVVIVTPGCQDIVTLIDEKGQFDGGFSRLTMAAINPHTTQAKGRDCLDCHGSTKAVGLGDGRVTFEGDRLLFHGVEKGVEAVDGRTVPLDSYVSADGQPEQYSSRPGLRPFNGEELRRILKVGQCVGCHNEYSDPIWGKYKPDTKCKRKDTNGNR